MAVCGLFAEPLTSASMNPTRSLGPAIVNATATHLWIYVVAPLFGAVLATLTSWMLHPDRNADEVEAACGEPKPSPPS